MSSEPPPEKSYAEDRGLEAQSPRASTRRREIWGSRGNARRSVAIAGVLAIAVGVSLFLFLTQRGGGGRQEGVAAPAVGLACPYLKQAAEAYDRGDPAMFDDAIERAAKVAEDTLQTSGQTFGTPERIAIQLRFGENGDVQRLLARAEAACLG